MPAAACAAEHIAQAMQEGRHMAACFVPYLVILDQGAAVQAQVVALLARGRGASRLQISSCLPSTPAPISVWLATAWQSEMMQHLLPLLLQCS